MHPLCSHVCPCVRRYVDKAVYLVWYIYFILYFLYSIVPLYLEGNLSKVNDVNHRIYIHAPHTIVSSTTTNTIRMLQDNLSTYHNWLRCPIRLSCLPLFSVF